MTNDGFELESSEHHQSRSTGAGFKTTLAVFVIWLLMGRLVRTLGIRPVSRLSAAVRARRRCDTTPCSVFTAPDGQPRLAAASAPRPLDTAST